MEASRFIKRRGMRHDLISRRRARGSSRRAADYSPARETRLQQMRDIHVQQSRLATELPEETETHNVFDNYVCQYNTISTLMHGSSIHIKNAIALQLDRSRSPTICYAFS